MVLHRQLNVAISWKVHGAMSATDDFQRAERTPILR
jgi:hypothetical protein